MLIEGSFYSISVISAQDAWDGLWALSILQPKIVTETKRNNLKHRGMYLSLYLMDIKTLIKHMFPSMVELC